MIAMRLGTDTSGDSGGARRGVWEPEEKNGSWMLNGSWNAYAGKNAAVAARKTAGDLIVVESKGNLRSDAG